MVRTAPMGMVLHQAVTAIHHPVTTTVTHRLRDMAMAATGTLHRAVPMVPIRDIQVMDTAATILHPAVVLLQAAAAAAAATVHFRLRQDLAAEAGLTDLHASGQLLPLRRASTTKM